MSSDWTFPPVPAELKSLAPYFQRAQELRTKDPVMSYWCTYYAAKQGISAKVQSKDARPFLFQVMSVLEDMKAMLGDNDAVSDDDAGAVYIENFALRVFNMADNEDRREQATRSTAKKFLASANFFELLRLFDKPMEDGVEEKIRYAKWKAADLAKAFREGRKPIPGDANAPSAASPSLPLSESVLSPTSPTTLEPPHDSAPSMSAWSPGTSLAPSPAAQGMQSLGPSPTTGTDVPLPQTVSNGNSPEPAGSSIPGEQASPSLPPQVETPHTPSPRSISAQLNLGRENDGFVTPGMWSTVATPGIEDVYQASDAMGGISESPSVRAAARRNGVPVNDMDVDVEGGSDTQDDAWSTAGNHNMSRQNSWTVVDTTPAVPEGTMPPPPPPLGLGLGLQSDSPPPLPPVFPVKKVHFSPSVVGGLSSTSSSVAGSSPPGSPDRYAPSLPTVQEAGYSSDSDRDAALRDVSTHVKHDPAMFPLPESGSSASEAEGSPQGLPPVVHKVSSPTGPLSPNVPSPRNLPAVPPPPVFPAPIQSPPNQPNNSLPPPHFPVIPSERVGLSPQPPAPLALHPTPRFVSTPLMPTNGNNHIPLRSLSPPPDLTSTQIARIQKHCRFAISALDYEDAETARKELRAALAMLGS